MSILTAIKKVFGFGSNGDRKLNCEDCKKEFVFDAGEQKFFKAKGFTDPKRCPRCRKTVKTRIRRGPKKSPRRKGARFGRRRSLIEGNSPYQDE